MAKLTLKRGEIQKVEARVRKKLGSILTPGDSKRIGQYVIDEMRSLIESGVSPIVGAGFTGRFPGYKNPAKYPGTRKSSSPVNLRLSGQQLGALGSRVSSSKGGNASVVVGYNDSLAKKKEQGHREGVNSQPKRPTIPDTSQGETFHQSIVQGFYERVRQLVRKSLSK